MVSATDGSAFTGAVTISVTGDAGTQGTGSVGAGACAHEGNGYHTYAPAQAETNYDLIAFTFTGTGAIPQTVQVFTRLATPDVNVASLTAGAIAAATFAAGAFDAVWSVAARILTAGTNIVLAKGTGVTGFNDLSAAQVNTEADTALTDAGVTTTVTGRIDAAVSSRSSHSAADVWAAATRTLTAFDASFKTGYALSAAGVQAIWDALTSALTTVGSIGKLLVDNIPAIKTKTDQLTFTLSNQLDARVMSMNTDVVSDDAIEDQAGNEIANAVRAELAVELARIDAAVTSRSSHSAADVWSAGTRTLTAATNITSTGGTTVPQTGDSFARLGAAGAGLTAVAWNAAWDTEVQSEVQDALDATLADSVPADGTRPSAAQALYMLTQFMVERSVSGTTLTVRKTDGSTALFTLTMNDATSPTSITRAT